MAAIEEGTKPKGGVTIVKSMEHILELQAVAKATDSGTPLLLTAKKSSEKTPAHLQEVLLPYFCNLAFVQAVCGRLDGEKPSIEQEKVKETALNCSKASDLCSLRVHIPTEFVQERLAVIFERNQEYCIHTLDDTVQEAKTSGWVKSTDNEPRLHTGYVAVKRTAAANLLKKSGKSGIFISR